MSAGKELAAAQAEQRELKAAARALRDARILKRAREGLSVTAIAEAVHVEQRTFRLVCRAAGVALAKRGERE